jgi:hypothetical protein
MDSSPNQRWQFSLRALMLAMVACAVFFGVGKVWGATGLVWLSLGSLVAAPLVMLTGAARYAWLTAVSAVYGPFVVMATYTYFFVACSHCKETTWALLPYGPGMIAVELARQWIGIDRFDDTVWFGISFVVAAVLVTGLAWVLRTRGWWWRAIGAVVVLALCSICAFVMLALIQA